LILFEDHPPERDHPNHGIINEELSNSLSSSFTLCIQPLWKRYQRFQSNRAERNVEFVLAPQHETSCDPETTTKEDFDQIN